MSGIGKGMMTVQEVADYLRVAPSTMRNKAFRRRIGIKGVRVGQSMRFPREEVDAFLRRNTEDEMGGTE